MNAEKNFILDFLKYLRISSMHAGRSLDAEVVFIVSNQRFPASPSLKFAASPVLGSMLTNGTKEISQSDVVSEEVDVEAQKAVLDYTYASQMNLVNVGKVLLYLKCPD